MDFPNKKKIFDTRAWILCLAVYAAGFIVLTQRFGQVSFSDQFMFLISQFAFVLVPGMAAARLLMGPFPVNGHERDGAAHTGSLIKFIAISYLLGIVLVILEFYIFYSLGAKESLLIEMAAVALASVWFLFGKKEDFRNIPLDNREGWALSALLAGLLTMVFFSAVYASKVPDLGGHPSMSYYQDLLWNTGNTTAIANGFPVMDIHVEGITFSYHFFTNVFLAAFRNILGISSFVLYFKFLPVLQVIVFAGAMYLLLSLTVKNVWVRTALVAATLFSSIILMRHMLWQAYATVFALSFTIAAAYFLLRAFKDIEKIKVFKNRDFLLFLVFLCAAVGTKSLFAVMLIAGAGIVFLMQMIRRKNTLQMFAGGIAMLGVLAFMMFTMVVGAHGYNGLSAEALTPMLAANPAYYQALLSAVGETAAALIAYPVYLFLNHTVIAAALVMLVVYMAARRKPDVVAVFLLSGILAGIVAASVFFQPGYSNVLFMVAAVPFGVFAVFYVLMKGLEGGKVKTSGKIILVCIAAAITVWSVLPTAQTVVQDWQGKLENQNNVSPYDGITAEEYEGMKWIADHTPKDAVVASDRIYYVPGEDDNYARYFYYTAFSERENFLEGYYYINTYDENYQQLIDERLALLKRVYTSDPAAVAVLADQGVDYLVSSTFMTPAFYLDKSLGEVVFSNGGITIYRLYQNEKTEE